MDLYFNKLIIKVDIFYVIRGIIEYLIIWKVNRSLLIRLNSDLWVRLD